MSTRPNRRLRGVRSRHNNARTNTWPSAFNWLRIFFWRRKTFLFSLRRKKISSNWPFGLANSLRSIAMPHSTHAQLTYEDFLLDFAFVTGRKSRGKNLISFLQQKNQHQSRASWDYFNDFKERISRELYSQSFM